MFRLGPIALAILLLAACADDASTPSDACVQSPGAAPTLSLGRAVQGSLAFEPLADGAVLPIFDGTQGVVATWLVVRIEHGVSYRPRVAIRVTRTDGGAVLASGGALLTPFQDLGCDAFLRPEHMIPFDAICCAKDYDGLTVELAVTAVWDDGSPPVNTTLRATLELAPFPL